MILYKASSGNKYNFYGATMRATEGTLHKYKWTPIAVKSKFGENIKEFGKDAVQYEITLNFRGELSERKKELDEIREDFERDILDKKPGRIYFNNYYIDGYCIESETGVSNTRNTWSENRIIFYCPYPFWIKEYSYYFKASEITSTNNKRYANKYAYRYANGLNNTYITNEHYAECNFHMNIYGPCVKPSVYIGGHEYHVNAILEAGESWEIDSAAETVTKVMNSGKRVNMFHYRSFGSTLFQPIQTGMQNIFWDGKFDFDLILFEERSEPKWS